MLSAWQLDSGLWYQGISSIQFEWRVCDIIHPHFLKFYVVVASSGQGKYKHYVSVHTTRVVTLVDGDPNCLANLVGGSRSPGRLMATLWDTWTKTMIPKEGNNSHLRELFMNLWTDIWHARFTVSNGEQGTQLKITFKPPASVSSLFNIFIAVSSSRFLNASSLRTSPIRAPEISHSQILDLHMILLNCIREYFPCRYRGHLRLLTRTKWSLPNDSFLFATLTGTNPSGFLFLIPYSV